MSDAVALLAICGSLRRGSSNHALLAAAARLLPVDVSIRFYDDLASLPAFNPDADGEPAHAAVAGWRRALAQADGVIISSPEYAHGVPGALKNALDWVVGSGELMDKPVALLNPSPTSTFAHPQLAETLRTMSAVVVPEASVTIAIPRRGATDRSIVADAAIEAALRAAIDALLRAVRSA